MKKIIALILVVIIVAFSITSCTVFGYSTGDILINIGFNNQQRIYAKVKSYSYICNVKNVAFDFEYGLYYIYDHQTPDQVKYFYHYIPSEKELQNGVRHTESDFAIYISNNAELLFETEDNIYLLDPKTKVNAKLWKFISFEEAFASNYGYSSSKLKVIYNHSEELFIPAEFFTQSQNHVYIHIVCLERFVDENAYSNDIYNHHTLDIEYSTNGDFVLFKK